MNLRLSLGIALALTAVSVPGFAQWSNQYAVVLSEPAAATRTTTRAAMLAERQRVAGSQASVRSALQSRHYMVTGSASMLLNAVFVTATPDRVAELESLPGVQGVVRLRKYKRSLNKALPLLAADGAWSALGGFPNAGKGIKIGMLDSGIDQNHPSMQDNTLQVPPGFPKCDTASNCTDFTNSKVIVARSYVRQLVAGGGQADDYSARDRSGHGTAVATCATGNTSAGSVTISGVAPKAWVGSYKIFGSPEVNDFATDDVIVTALEDAIADGMDVISMSVGGTAFTGPTDTGAACGNNSGVPCDISASAFEAAAQKGALIVVAAGNDGANGLNYPTFGSVASPGTAPSVITVGGTTNAHGFTPSVRIPGSNVPANLANVPAQPTDSYSPYGALAGPLVDVANLGNDGYACAALTPGSLANSFALVQRGPAGADACAFSTKMQNVVNA
ncbi:MAG TPA: S8 family serine peptidase, partial [Bryobacteraceae bacterium]|nr:S8 family serine peptidase [Bryobacteraceae bacterium]